MKTLHQSVLIICLLFSIAAASQVPAYNSFPSASATVFLDFDGQYVTGTSWNSSGPIDCGSSNMTSAQITEIFERVSEDYRPFNINITTDSTKYWSAPVNKRMRVILTISSSWYGSAGGVSFLNSFVWADNTPCFVFTALLGYSSKKVAEATSHEIGHTLGLNHQSSYDNSCIKTSEYNAGLGSGEIGWAPIMGNSYYRNLTLWHNGTNPYGCTNFQDDLGIITGAANGFGYRTDDYSNAADATATAAVFSNNQFSVNGVIEKITDKDVFAFTLPSQGSFHLDANPYSIASANTGSNLDMQVELLNAGQTVLGVYNPDVLLNSTIDTTLTAGTYYLRVQGIGNAYAPDYATLGSYNLTASFTPSIVLPLHKLELHGTNENNRHQLNWIVEADETITRQVLEVSTTGSHFQPLASLQSNLRNYNYVPGNGSMLYYRLNVEFDNHTQYYSNIVSLRNNAKNNKPYVAGNMVNSSVTVISPEVFAYSIIDLTGKTLIKGKLFQGRNVISTGSLSKGMYLIRFTSGQEQYVERWIKQ